MMDKISLTTWNLKQKYHGKLWDFYHDKSWFLLARWWFQTFLIFNLPRMPTYQMKVFFRWNPRALVVMVSPSWEGKFPPKTFVKWEGKVLIWSENTRELCNIVRPAIQWCLEDDFFLLHFWNGNFEKGQHFNFRAVFSRLDDISCLVK